MRKVAVLLGITWAITTTPLRAEVIYANTNNDLAVRFNPGTLEVGDEIILAGNQRYLTNFAFEYWGTNTAGANNPLFSGVVTARVRFYKNDGPEFAGYPTPGTQFWDSDWFSVFPTPRSALVFTAGLDFPASGLYVPASVITWSVQFQGMRATDKVGVDFYSPPDLGQDYPDYWENSGAQWALKTNSMAADFAAQLEAQFVPDPAIPFVALSAITNTAVVSWPGWATNYALEASAVVGPGADWKPAHGTATWVDNNFVLTTNINSATRFFRLRQQP